MNRRDATFLATLSMGFASIYSAEYADQLMAAGTRSGSTAPLSGAARSSSSVSRRDAVVRYRANPDYFADKPGVERVIFAITPDSNVRLQKHYAVANARSPCHQNHRTCRPSLVTPS